MHFPRRPRFLAILPFCCHKESLQTTNRPIAFISFLFKEECTEWALINRFCVYKSVNSWSICFCRHLWIFDISQFNELEYPVSNGDFAYWYYCFPMSVIVVIVRNTWCSRPVSQVRPPNRPRKPPICCSAMPELSQLLLPTDSAVLSYPVNIILLWNFVRLPFPIYSRATADAVLYERDCTSLSPRAVKISIPINVANVIYQLLWNFHLRLLYIVVRRFAKTIHHTTQFTNDKLYNRYITMAVYGLTFNNCFWNDQKKYYF